MWNEKLTFFKLQSLKMLVIKLTIQLTCGQKDLYFCLLLFNLVEQYP